MADDFELAVVSRRTAQRHDRRLAKHGLGKHHPERLAHPGCVHKHVKAAVGVAQRTVVTQKWHLYDPRARVGWESVELWPQLRRQPDDGQPSIGRACGYGCEGVEQRGMPLADARLPDPAEEHRVLGNAVRTPPCRAVTRRQWGKRSRVHGIRNDDAQRRGM